MKTASGVKNPALMVEGHTERDREALQSCRERRGGVPKVTGTGRGLGKWAHLVTANLGPVGGATSHTWTWWTIELK